MNKKFLSSPKRPNTSPTIKPSVAPKIKFDTNEFMEESSLSKSINIKNEILSECIQKGNLRIFLSSYKSEKDGKDDDSGSSRKKVEEGSLSLEQSVFCLKEITQLISKEENHTPLWMERAYINYLEIIREMLSIDFNIAYYKAGALYKQEYDNEKEIEEYHILAVYVDLLQNFTGKINSCEGSMFSSKDDLCSAFIRLWCYFTTNSKKDILLFVDPKVKKSHLSEYIAPFLIETPCKITSLIDASTKEPRMSLSPIIALLSNYPKKANGKIKPLFYVSLDMIYLLNRFESSDIKIAKERVVYLFENAPSYWEIIRDNSIGFFKSSKENASLDDVRDFLRCKVLSLEDYGIQRELWNIITEGTWKLWKQEPEIKAYILGFDPRIGNIPSKIIDSAICELIHLGSSEYFKKVIHPPRKHEFCNLPETPDSEGDFYFNDTSKFSEFDRIDVYNETHIHRLTRPCFKMCIKTKVNPYSKESLNESVIKDMCFRNEVAKDQELPDALPLEDLYNNLTDEKSTSTRESSSIKKKEKPKSSLSRSLISSGRLSRGVFVIENSEEEEEEDSNEDNDSSEDDD